MKRMSHRSSDIVRLGVATGAAATGLAIAGTAVGAALIAKALLRGSRRYHVRDKSVLITGGSRGLGLVLAREFAKRGARVAVCARSAAELERAKAASAIDPAALPTLRRDPQTDEWRPG